MAIEDRTRLPALSLIHRRPRLLNMLAEFVQSGKRLISTYAPSGYGKSILLADFAQTTNLPVCWCSLEPVDRDPTSFLTLLAYSVTDRFHEIEPASLLRFVERGDTQASIQRITHLLQDVGPHLIIFDDYHKAVSAGMSLALNKLLAQLPAASTMIVAARGDLTLATDQIIDLLLAEQAAGLSEEELRFTGPELQLVMRKRFGRRIDLDSAEELARITDGNIAQILLTGHLMHADQLLGQLSQNLNQDREIIYRYLAQEVFEKQSAELQQFMLATAILPDMTVEICNALLEIEDAQDRLQELVRRDLFVAQVGARFKYHDLFAEFLRAKLAQNQSDYRDVALKAAALLVSQSRVAEAVSLYLSVEAWPEVAALLETRGKFFYETGRALTLHSWLAQIPETVASRFPHLLLLRGQILNNDLGQPEQALAIFQRAEDKFRENDDRVGLAEAQLWRAVRLRMIGQAQASMPLISQGLAQLEALQADPSIMAWAIRNRGLTHWTLGNLSDALADIRHALALYETLDDTYRVGMCHHEVGVFLEKQGNVSGARYHFKQALQIWESLGNANDLANTLNSLGVSYWTMGQYEEALKYLQDSLDIALHIHSTRRAAFAQSGIGDAYLGQHKLDEAREAYQRSSRFAREAKVQSLEIYNQVRLGECFYQRGDLDQALKQASRAREVAVEIGLHFEQGLACALQVKIYVSRAEYEASWTLSEQALACFTDNDVLEQAKTRLWWGYSLLLDLRGVAAFDQLQEVIRLSLAMGELVQGLEATVTETQQLLVHFLHRADTGAGTQDSIRLLLAQSPQIDPTHSSLQIFALGTPYLIVGGQRRQFSGRGRARKMPEFLAYLLIEGGDSGCRWDEISSAIWPELDSDRASVSFHQTLRRLREVIFEATDYIVVQDDHYLLNPNYLGWTDLLAFERLYDRSTKLAPEKALSVQLELIELYRGEFLVGFELESWGLAYRAAVGERFLQTIRLAAEQLLRQDAPREALELIQRGLTNDYFREDLHRVALKAYARLGLYADLSRHYQGVCQFFDQELAAPPDATTTHLYQELMATR